MRIAVISDTHNRLPEHVIAAIREADEIWHLGDVTDVDIVETLRSLGPPLRVVRGNCDECGEWPRFLDFMLAGQFIRLEHVPPRQPPEPFDLLLHGHTHVPRDEMVRGTRYLNPGTVGNPNKGLPASYAWLTLVEGEPPDWRIVRV